MWASFEVEGSKDVDMSSSVVRVVGRTDCILEGSDRIEYEFKISRGDTGLPREQGSVSTQCSPATRKKAHQYSILDVLDYELYL